MRRLLPLLTASIAAMLAACVTINVYFPAAAAQAAADRVIDEVWGGSAAPAPAAPPAGETSSSQTLPVWRNVAASALGFLIPAAHAADPDLDISSPSIKQLTSSMESRFPDLVPYLESGAIGIGINGFIETRDASLIPLPKRNAVRTLLANENADRSALYREIAQANGKAEWETQIREVFAKRWIARAKSGWYVQTSVDSWKRK